MKISEKVFAYYNKNSMIVFMLLGIFILGISIGCYSLMIIPENKLLILNDYTNKFFSAQIISLFDKKSVFLENFLGNLKLFTLIWISSLFVFFIPVSLLQIFFKGFRCGFTLTYFAEIYKFKGILYSFLNYFLNNLIILPIIILYTVYCIKNAVKIHKKSIIKNNLLESITMYLLCIFSCAITSFLDGYFITYFMKLVAIII